MFGILKQALEWINEGATRLWIPYLLGIPKPYRLRFSKAQPNNWTWKHSLVLYSTMFVVLTVPKVLAFWIIPTDWWDYWSEWLIALLVLWYLVFFILLTVVTRNRSQANFRNYVRSWENGKAPICFACEYDLRGTTASVCPECGSEILTADRFDSQTL